jgi:hypothetical protein
VPVTRYPEVLNEVDTLTAVVAGRSLARYGDGELKMCTGSSIKSQRGDPALAGRLRGILQSSGHCLVGIPNIHSETPKRAFWSKHERFAHLLADRPYVSSFITRPDSAPWIDAEAYWAQLESLWVGQEVTLVRGSTKSLTAEDLVGAARVTEIVAPRQHAWSEYAQLLERVGRPKRALLCLGPTATVMAVDLCAHGVHAIDLGHVGMFLRKRRRGESLTVTEEDRAS